MAQQTLVQGRAQPNVRHMNDHTAHDAPLWDVLLRPQGQEQINQRNVVIDAVGVGITAGVGSFLSVFLVRLGASSFLIGLLTAMPALTGMLLAMPVGEFLARRPNVVPWFARSRFWVLSSYVLTGLVPFIFKSNQPEIIILIWALATVPQTVVSVAFTVVMGGVAGPRGRLTLMSRRWSTLGLTNSLTVVIVGQLLNLFNFPLNYQIVFIGSAIGAFISVVFSSSLKLPPQQITQAPPKQGGVFGSLRERGRDVARRRPFLNFIIAQFVFRWGLTLAMPLLPIYWVKQVGASDPQISAINSAGTFVAMIAYFVWTKVSGKRGPRFVLLLAAFGTSFYPLLTALTRTPLLLPLWAGMHGFFFAGVDLVFFEMVLATSPAENQASYIGFYHTTVYVATFVAPLIGSALVDAIGLIPLLVIATLLRLTGTGLMLWLGVGRQE
ncbi:MAG: Major Facilitator Superfamily protein [Chloroflexi bacterium ADurb.Bin325]|nr:MAG: Major Facilitator Superfamily protein [Chloroflexi bacterium ADurb.Bin325]